MRVYGQEAIDRFIGAYASRETLVILECEFQVTGVSVSNTGWDGVGADVTLTLVRRDASPGVSRES